MARGGRREGAGRRKGSTGIRSSKTKARVAIAERALETGITPLDYMLSVLRNTEASEDKRYKAAVDAAPYIHPRLSSVEANVKISEHEDNLRRLREAAMPVPQLTQDHEQLH